MSRPANDRSGFIRRVAYIAGLAAAAVLFTAATNDTPTQGSTPAAPGSTPACAHHYSAGEFRPFAKAVWQKDRWRRGQPEADTLAAGEQIRACAASWDHRLAMRRSWRAAKHRYYRHADRQFRACGPEDCRLLARRWIGGGTQYGCLDALWNRESQWLRSAHNPSSGAHGIPQALPGSKMGPGWESDGKVQMRWGLGYIRGRYGSPCSALGASDAQGWY